jgi:hypothetical protein
VTTRYAATTDVTADRSRSEIERTLQRYGARSFMYGWDDDRAVLGFVAGGRQVRFVLPMPDRNDRSITHTPSTKVRRSEKAIAEAFDQAVRQRWRALALVIKAKLEAVQAGIVTFDEEFLAHLVLPSGETVGQAVVPNVVQAYTTGQTPSLLPAYDRKELTAGV